MKFIFPSNSLLSSIAAISIENCISDNIYIKNDKLQSFGRLYSINSYSKMYLANLGIWKNLDKDKITPYKYIDVYQNNKKTIEFNSSDINISFLGYIVNEEDLINAVNKKLSEANKINLFKKIPIFNKHSSINILTNFRDVNNTGQSVTYQQKDYDQVAINITISHSSTNGKIPRQIFYKDEILGFLPIDEHNYNLIWSLPNKLFKKIISSSSEQYIKLINDRAKFILGDIEKIIIGNSFPLSSRHADKYFYNNNLLIGEAAHKFHPLAGLGLNMGIEDISILHQLLSTYDSSQKIFHEYAIKRINRNLSLQKILDLIINFHASKIISNKYKQLILNYFNNSMLVKSKIIKNATGSINQKI